MNDTCRRLPHVTVAPPGFVSPRRWWSARRQGGVETGGRRGFRAELIGGFKFGAISRRKRASISLALRHDSPVGASQSEETPLHSLAHFSHGDGSAYPAATHP